MRKILILVALLFAYSNMQFVNASSPVEIKLTSENTISFNEAFSSMYIAKKQVEAINLCNKKSKSKDKDIYITLYTPGGSISAGKLFFDTLKGLSCNFHTITIAAFSMGYQTVQNLGTRYILPSGVLMSHRASVGGLRGEVYGELDSILNLIKKEVTELDVIASNRVGVSVKAYRNSISDELWLTGKDAVNLNHADKIALPKCGKSLLGTYTKTVRTFFGNLQVEFSRCPLITAPLRVIGSNRKAEKSFIKKFINIRNYAGYEL